MDETRTGPQETRDPRALFDELLGECLARNSVVRIVLSKYRGPEAGLQRILVRPVTLKGQECLSFVYRYQTRDVTKNLPLAEARAAVADLVSTSFGHVHMQTLAEDVQLYANRKGVYRLQRGKAAPQGVASKEHDRKKQRFVDLGSPFLVDLGVTDKQHQLIPSMSRKWRQINKFIEVLDHAFASSSLKDEESVRVVDFGSGKGYLTFAVEDYLRTRLGRKPSVTGVELREDLVNLCAGAARRLEIDGLTFQQGDVRSYAPEAIDIMIALHACDIATDHAIHLGIRSGAAIIMCAPCCHKQIRPQMQSPRILEPMLGHGIHLGQEAEMVTDSLRALLLEASGYTTRIFEFVALEHTSKNKMILAVKGSSPVPRDERLAQIKEIKEFYGVQEHCLETLLRADGLE